MQSIDFLEEIIKLCKPIFEVPKDLIEIPPDNSLGDYALPCFRFAKAMKKAPAKIAEDFAQQLKPNDIISEIKNVGPYLNFFISPSLLISSIMGDICQNLDKYGSSTEGNGKTVLIDFSSPNIAKPFGIAHIRSTVIGHSLYKIYSKLGYKVIRVNHLGDWGTQFGKLMVAYRLWGDEARLNAEGIDYLVEIYIEFGNKAKEDPALDEQARRAFKDLEEKKPEAIRLWQLFRDLSLVEFKKYYVDLGVDFDYYQGEAFYNDQLDQTVDFVKEKVTTQVNDGALIVDLSAKGIKVPLMLRKSDEATTYHTRDIAAALYRMKTYHPDKLLYVVGTQQKLHFQQLFVLLEMIGVDASKFNHVNFGTMSYEGAKMSTRLGNFILLRDVLKKAIDLAAKIISEKNPDLINKEKVAKDVGIGAIIFGDLSNDRTRDVDFTWDKALSFEGETAPYLQYTHARICSIQRKSDVPFDLNADPNLLKDPAEWDLIKLLGKFKEIIRKAAEDCKPHLVATYLIEVAQSFNKFYNRCPVLKEELALRNARLILIEGVRLVIANGLDLLGIAAPVEM